MARRQLVMSHGGEPACEAGRHDSPFSRQRAAGLDVPRVRGDGVEREALGDLRRRHGTFHVLFVGQNEDGRLPQVLQIQAGGDAGDAPRTIHVNRKRQKHSQWNI